MRCCGVASVLRTGDVVRATHINKETSMQVISVQPRSPAFLGWRHSGVAARHGGAVAAAHAGVVSHTGRNHRPQRGALADTQCDGAQCPGYVQALGDLASTDLEGGPAVLAWCAPR
jgi:hypothetical protein